MRFRTSDKPKLDVSRIEKNGPTLPTWYVLKIRLLKNIASVYQQCMFKFKTHKDDPSLMNEFQNTKFQAACRPHRTGFPVPNTTEADKRASATKSLLLLLEKQNHLSIVRWHVSTKSDPFVRSITNHVLANCIRIC